MDGKDNESEENVSLLELYCLIRDVEATNALSSEVTSVASAFAERLSATDQLKLTSCGWTGTFERGISSSEVRGLLPTDPPSRKGTYDQLGMHDGGAPVDRNNPQPPQPSPPPVTTQQFLDDVDSENMKRLAKELPQFFENEKAFLTLLHNEINRDQINRDQLSLPYDYIASTEVDVDITFSGPGHVLRWAKKNCLWPKKGDAAQWNWFFDTLLGRDGAPKDRNKIIRKDFINDRVQGLAYPVTISHRKPDLAERFAKSKVRTPSTLV